MRPRLSDFETFHDFALSGDGADDLCVAPFDGAPRFCFVDIAPSVDRHTDGIFMTLGKDWMLRIQHSRTAADDFLLFTGGLIYMYISTMRLNAICKYVALRTGRMESVWRRRDRRLGECEHSALIHRASIIPVARITTSAVVNDRHV